MEDVRVLVISQANGIFRFIIFISPPNLYPVLIRNTGVQNSYLGSLNAFCFPSPLSSPCPIFPVFFSFPFSTRLLE